MRNFDFLDFLKLHFFGLKIILSCQEYQKTIFSRLICEINTLDKIFDFLQNFYFLDFFKTSFLWSKQHCFLSRTSKNDLFWLNLPIKYHWEYIRFFDKNHGLTPLKTFDFLDFLKLHFFGLKIVLSCQEYQKTVFSGLIWEINTIDKIFDFFTKTMD